MLEVHPPRQAAHSWKDFFIHIATIVLGLLIAIGLEQMVERIHEYYELRVAREALEREFQSNRAILAADESNWLETLARLKNNLLVLEFVRDHPKTPQTELPGELQWHQGAFRWDHAVWDTAENKGIVRLMSLREANRNQAFYSLMTLMSAQSPLDTDPSGMAAAHRRTEDRIKAAMEEGDAAGRVPPR